MPATLKVTELKNTLIVQSSDTNLVIDEDNTDTLIVPVVETRILSIPTPSNGLIIENTETGIVKLSAGNPAKIIIRDESPKLVKEDGTATKLSVNKINSRVTPITEVVSVIAVAQQGPAGTDYGVFVEGVTPAGAIDGANNIFSLPQLPINDSFYLYLNGLRLKHPNDYIRSGFTLTMFAIPFPGDNFLADYRYT